MKGINTMKRILLSMILASLLLGTVGCKTASGDSQTTSTPDSTAAGNDPDTTVPQGTTEAPVFVMPENLVNVVEECGVANDGSDCTSKLRSAILRSKQVFLPAGTYCISSPIVLRDDVTIVGEEGTKIIVKGDTDLFQINGTPATKQNQPATREKNITIANLEIEAENQIRHYAVNARSVENLTVYGLKVLNMGCLVTHVVYDINGFDGTYDPVATAGVFSDDCLSTNITVSHCDIDCGAYGEEGATGVYLQFLTNFLVEETNVRNAWQGIQFWGGDSAYDRGGKPDNPCYAKNGLIRNCTADNIGGGGVWGSMGQDILITNCTVNNCRDVGIDFEGCRDVTASYCKASNCGNGNYSTFMYCTGKVLFSYCESIQENGYTQHFFNSNATQKAANHDITFDHCTFTSDAMSWVNCQSAMTNFTFTNNTCINTVLNTSGRNIYYVDIENNTFTMTNPLAEQRPAAIYAVVHFPDDFKPEGDSIKVVNNTVTTACAEEQYDGIVIAYSKRAGQCTAVCENNTVSGFARDIVLNGFPVAVNPFHVQCTNNTADSLITVNDVNCIASGNRTASGAELTPVAG